jgi:GNAT superfamily N-acetyltransferase
VQPVIRIDAATARSLEEACPVLARLLVDCVHGGASLGFLAPLRTEEAAAYWEGLAASVADGTIRLLLARDGSDEVVGTGLLRFEQRPNGRHRAEVSKVMVAPGARGRGVATALMEALEREARAFGIVLLHLDTSEGPGGARGFYEELGWAYVGGIPGYALDPDGTPADNAIFYRRLEPRRPGSD